MATPADAEHIVAILEEVASERIYTAITRPWSAAEQKSHMAALSQREIVHLAENERRTVVGYQVLELWAPTIDSMAHVGQVGTFVTAAWRGQGVGAALFRSTLDFALGHGYGKFVIQDRARNTPGQAFYKRLGFRECGRLTRQVRSGDDEEDEIIMEFFL
jgi:RimJ/RimL family protein N-acetyltransferase